MVIAMNHEERNQAAERTIRECDHKLSFLFWNSFGRWPSSQAEQDRWMDSTIEGREAALLVLEDMWSRYATPTMLAERAAKKAAASTWPRPSWATWGGVKV
jgi:hypothetical protein